MTHHAVLNPAPLVSSLLELNDDNVRRLFALQFDLMSSSCANRHEMIIVKF